MSRNTIIICLVWSILMESIPDYALLSLYISFLLIISCLWIMTEFPEIIYIHCETNFLPLKDDRIPRKYIYSLWDKDITDVHNAQDSHKNEITMFTLLITVLCRAWWRCLRHLGRWNLWKKKKKNEANPKAWKHRWKQCCHRMRMHFSMPHAHEHRGEKHMDNTLTDFQIFHFPTCLHRNRQHLQITNFSVSKKQRPHKNYIVWRITVLTKSKSFWSSIHFCITMNDLSKGGLQVAHSSTYVICHWICVFLIIMRLGIDSSTESNPNWLTHSLAPLNWIHTSLSISNNSDLVQSIYSINLLTVKGLLHNK
jgi:hypothetical protein